MRKRKFKSFLIILIEFLYYLSCSDDFCSTESEICNQKKPETRYLLYDVNPPEGFNLRRDVYMRMAVLAHKLQKTKDLANFKLVLPPWSHLFHWKFKDTPEQFPWAYFFDVDSMRQFAPVLEMHEFFNDFAGNKYTTVKINEVYVLQHFADMFETGNFEDRMEIAPCLRKPRPTYFYYNNITSGSIRCLSFHGPSLELMQLLRESRAKTILVDHAEVALHEYFGSQLYWQARRSMRFNKDLREIACKFRETNLNSTDLDDNTVLPANWKDEKPGRGAKGGPYLSVHLRRRDFLIGRANEVPSIESIIKQIDNFLQTLNLQTVFIATDASETEHESILTQLSNKYKVVKYVPDDETRIIYGEAGAAIIDQIICSYAQFFVGTHESTFSFRIQEEREILGFPEETTFNCFCKEGEECPQPSVWKIVH